MSCKHSDASERIVSVLYNNTKEMKRLETEKSKHGCGLSSSLFHLLKYLK